METAARISKNIHKTQTILKLFTYLNLGGFLWPQPAVIKDGYTADIIIVGGGTAGCIVASNLARLNVKVLLIEAGGQPAFETELPGLFPFVKNTDYDWNFTSVRDDVNQRYHKGEATDLLQGKVLGGSAQVNYMIYGMGHPKDYQEWVDITNDSSWSYRELCPLIKRNEKIIDKKILNSPDVHFHGTNGKVQIKKYYSKINDGIFGAYKELGYKVLNDINPNNTIGITNAYFTIGNQKRQSTAYAFLSPEKNNPYLKVMYKSLATKIIFDENKRAVGVQVLTEDKKLITVNAKKEVIVTAGTIKSPHLLMLSGIGPKDHLKEKGIKVISDLPVGQNFHDHPTCIVLHKMQEATPISPSNPYEFPVNVMEGRLAINKGQSYADYQVLSGVMDDPIYFLEICGFVFTFKNELCGRLYKKMYNRKIHFVTHNLLYSESRGELILNSTDPEDYPLIDPGYYTNERDLKRHAQFLKHFNSIVETSYYKSINAEFVDPELETCKGLQVGSENYWKNYVKGMSTTAHNYAGTCAMGSVVDSKLKVKGVKNLRVADASIIPTIVGANIQGTVMVIAQKLTDLLVKEYNLCSK
ncbi:hypothetical protein PYW07_005547 [Mythimna separata]|uniref:Glucose-methanol-choline oxidoreductase N-terminal domain-containing protein n=1 Tax=Mythimna separata TaxID=271217 RepID=A0AAD8DS08_MYTSE|nr:hypothetical protein PYW07_005547 [Mythimna separata]